MRNGSGGYVLPSASFVPDTLLVPIGPNLDFSDIATTLTDTIAADGQTTMIAPLIYENGVQAAPSVTFAGDTSTGLFLPGTGTIDFVISGAIAGSIGSSGFSGWTLPSTSIGNATLGTSSTFNASTFSYGAGSAAAQLLGMGMNAEIQYAIFVGGGTPPPNSRGFLEVPFPCTINRWTLMADQSGSAVLDVWRAPYASFPPTSGNSITSGSPPTLSSHQNAQSSSGGMVGVALNAGDWLAFNVNSATTVTRLNLSLFVTRTAQ